MDHNVSLVVKTNKNKKDLSHIRCYHYGKMGHYALKFSEKNIVKTERDVETSTVVEEYTKKFEQGFSLVSIDSSVGSSTFEHVWVVDSSATRHMTRIYDSFQMITWLGPGLFIQTNVDSPQIAIQGVGTWNNQVPTRPWRVPGYSCSIVCTWDESE